MDKNNNQRFDTQTKEEESVNSYRQSEEEREMDNPVFLEKDKGKLICIQR